MHSIAHPHHTPPNSLDAVRPCAPAPTDLGATVINPFPTLFRRFGIGSVGPPQRPLWPPMTDPVTVPTAHGPVAMVPRRRASGSSSGLRVSPISGRIRVIFMSRIRGSSGRSSFATRRAGILKPTAVSCRPGMSGLGNKAICDEIRKFGYPPVRLKSPPAPAWYGGEMEVHIDGTSRYDQAGPAGCFPIPALTTPTL